MKLRSLSAAEKMLQYGLVLPMTELCAAGLRNRILLWSLLKASHRKQFYSMAGRLKALI